MAGGGYRGTQGRKPKASTIVERERAKKTEDSEEANRARMPAAPRHLSKEAKKEWRRVGKYLLEEGRWKDIYTDALAMYCRALVQCYRALEMLGGQVGRCPNCDPDKEGERGESWAPCCPARHLGIPYGEVIKNRLGEAVRSPYVAQRKEAEAQMMRLEGEFGLTPSSHSRLPGGKATQQPPRRSFGQPVVSPGTSPDPREAMGWTVVVGDS